MLVNNNSINAAFIALVIFIFIAGFAVSAALANTDLMNFNRSSAEADRIRAETDWQNGIQQIDLPYLEAERKARSQAQVAQSLNDAKIISAEGERQASVIAAQAEAEVNRIRETARLEIARSEQDLSQQERWAETGMTLAKFAGLSISIILAYLGLRYIHIHTAINLPSQISKKNSNPKSADPWQNENFRRQQRCKAQLVERLQRQAENSALECFPIPVAMPSIKPLQPVENEPLFDHLH